jgi:hypothetical protein
MKKFIVLYHAPVGATESMAKTSPEDAKKNMEPWMAWAQKCGDALVDIGTPLGNARKVTKGGSSENKNSVVGFSVVQAPSMDEAVQLLQDHPHLQWLDACEIEVHESLELPGM